MCIAPCLASIRTAIGPLALIALAGCTNAPHHTESVDLNAAAEQASKTVAGYAATTPQAIASTNETPAAAADGDASAAISVVRTYNNLLAAHHYDQARALWDEPGKPAGRSPKDFAATFDRYKTYTATTGQTGRIDAGAGQRYVAVPVRVDGTLSNGARFTRTGSITLHRVADGIETEDPTAHQWRITQSDVM